MKKRLLIIILVIYSILVLVSTKALLDKNEFGVYVTKDSYYVCNKKIREYDESSLVYFEKNVDYAKLVDQDIYYYDNNKELQNSRLDFYDKENKTFSANDVSYDITHLLGRPIKAYQIVGSYLNLITSSAFYFMFVIVPIVILFIYEIYFFVKYVTHIRHRKGNNDDKESIKEE